MGQRERTKRYRKRIDKAIRVLQSLAMWSHPPQNPVFAPIIAKRQQEFARFSPDIQQIARIYLQFEESNQ